MNFIKNPGKGIIFVFIANVLLSYEIVYVLSIYNMYLLIYISSFSTYTTFNKLTTGLDGFV